MNQASVSSPTAAPKLAVRGKIAELDGVRAVSVIFVLLVHISYGRLSGGFLGVDIFFVLSGYLITMLMLKEIAGHGTVDLARFYVRRALRILPPLVVATTLGLALASRGGMLTADQYRQVAAVLLFYSNFETPQTMGNLAHTWSLAIEEQFYLVWPALLLLSLRVGRYVPAVVAGLIILGCLAVRFWMVATVADQTTIYTFTFARVDSIMLGSLLAIVEKPLAGVVAGYSSGHAAWGLVAWSSAAALLAVLFLGRREFMQSTPLAFITFALVAGLFIIACQRVQETSALRRVLGWPASQWLGQRSYGLYLYHYPIFGAMEAFRVQGDLANFALVAVLKVALSLAFTELAWRLVEQPILRLKKGFSVAVADTDAEASGRPRRH